jgi:hypothetical protein
MEEGSDNEAGESLLSTMKKKFLSCARDGTDAVIRYADPSTNRELQTCYEHLRIAREILIRQQQERSVSTELDSLFQSALLLYVRMTVHL